MIKPNEFVTRWENCTIPERHKWGHLNWQRSALVRYSPSIDTLPLSDTSRRFLIEAGLPSHVYQFQFGKPTNVLPTVIDAYPEWDFPPGYERYRVLATEIVTADDDELKLGFICVDLSEFGRIVHISLERNNRVEYVNDSVVQLAEYLILMQDYDEWYYRRYPPLDIVKLEGTTPQESYWLDFEYYAQEDEAKHLADLQHNDPHHQDRQAYADKIIERLRQVDPDGIDGFWREAVTDIRDME